VVTLAMRRQMVSSSGSAALSRFACWQVRKSGSAGELDEFGDCLHRYASATTRKNCAATSPGHPPVRPEGDRAGPFIRGDP
jgi:hypothetical protein